MPDITISLTVNQAQRVSAAFGPAPEGMTQAEWVVKNTKAFYKAQVATAESRSSSNAAHDAAILQANTDFGGF